MHRPSLPTRAAAWLVTGPVGHLAAGVADWVELAARLGWARLRAHPEHEARSSSR
ncbi:MAG: hypothetical protein M3469_00400 [Actinomycetota bacterium]|nr:hypothetical protein [Actinomycetota bacterium]